MKKFYCISYDFYCRNFTLILSERDQPSYWTKKNNFVSWTVFPVLVHSPYGNNIIHRKMPINPLRIIFINSEFNKTILNDACRGKFLF